jgi:hypothetical protein
MTARPPPETAGSATPSAEPMEPRGTTRNRAAGPWGADIALWGRVPTLAEAQARYDALLARKRRERARQWEAGNRDYRNAYKRHLRAGNPEARRAAYRRRHANPVQALSGAMRSSMRRAFTVKRLSADKDRRRWEVLVGYTAHELRAHIEKKFTGRMSWKNYGKWHVDHIIPVSSFSFQSVDDPDFRACWALTNLRPIWGPVNRRKAAKRTLLV